MKYYVDVERMERRKVTTLLVIEANSVREAKRQAKWVAESLAFREDETKWSCQEYDAGVVRVTGIEDAPEGEPS